MAKNAAPLGAPLWMVTFADLMSLLVCFFVLIISFSVPDTAQDRGRIDARRLRLPARGRGHRDGRDRRQPALRYAQELVPLALKDRIGPIPDDADDIEELSAREAVIEQLIEMIDPDLLVLDEAPTEVEEVQSSEDERFDQIASEGSAWRWGRCRSWSGWSRTSTSRRAPEGLRIQIVDQAKSSMFPLGRAQMYRSYRDLARPRRERDRAAAEQDLDRRPHRRSPIAGSTATTTGRSRSTAPTRLAACSWPPVSTRGASPP